MAEADNQVLAMGARSWRCHVEGRWGNWNGQKYTGTLASELQADGWVHIIDIYYVYFFG